MNKFDIYCYGMTVISHSFLLKGDFLKPDEYSELSAAYSFPGGETGTCATVLSSLGASVKIDGTHIGGKSEAFVRDFYSGKSVSLESLCFDGNFEGLEDYVVVHGDTRTPMGMFGGFFSGAWQTGVRHWNKPKEADIEACSAAAIDPFFWDDSDMAACYCIKHGKPYVTIDCKYDSFIHKHAAISVISGEGLGNNYPGKTREELFELFRDGSDGLTVITNGAKELIYGRRGEKMRRFTPYRVKTAKTLGAGDSFKAGCVYALLKNMSDEETVCFASACAAAAISRYPLQLYPPKLEEINALIDSRSAQNGKAAARGEDDMKKGTETEAKTKTETETRTKTRTVKVNFYEEIDDALLKFAVIISKHKGKYVFCKHRERSTLEIPGGHREAGEPILETAKRELYEETGAIDFEIKPVCVYSVTAEDNFDGQETFGMLYFADIKSFEPELHSEIERLVMTYGLPLLSTDSDSECEEELRRGWTYPAIQPRLIEEAKKRRVI